MKKEYPKKWCDIVSASFKALVTYFENGGRSKICCETEVLALLQKMDAAGMLKDIPEPLEINFCNYHGGSKNREGVCEVLDVYLSKGDTSYETICKFTKMKEVIE